MQIHYIQTRTRCTYLCNLILHCIFPLKSFNIIIVINSSTVIYFLFNSQINLLKIHILYYESIVILKYNIYIGML